MNPQGLFEKYVRTIDRTNPQFLGQLYSLADSIHGWMCQGQVFLLYTLAAHLKGKLVEIGSWKGRSTSVCRE